MKEQQLIAEIMRTLLVAGFCLGVICGVFFTGLLVALHR